MNDATSPTTTGSRNGGRGWTIFIGALFLYAFLAGGFFLYLAKTSYRGVVTTQAYRDSLAFDKELEKRRLTLNSQIEIEIVEYSPQLLIQIKKVNGGDVSSQELLYHALHLAVDGLDIAGKLIKTATPNLYKLDQVLSKRGVWLLTIESVGTEGDQIFWKEQITLR